MQTTQSSEHNVNAALDKALQRNQELEQIVEEQAKQLRQLQMQLEGQQ